MVLCVCTGAPVGDLDFLSVRYVLVPDCGQQKRWIERLVGFFSRGILSLPSAGEGCEQPEDEAPFWLRGQLLVGRIVTFL